MKIPVPQTSSNKMHRFPCYSICIDYYTKSSKLFTKIGNEISPAVMKQTVVARRATLISLLWATGLGFINYGYPT
jgi:hypothetical protein